MNLAKRRVRWAGVGVACVVSIGLGLALVFRVVTPETLSRVPTPELLAMVGLLVMPGIAIWAVHAERRARISKSKQVAALAQALSEAALVGPTPTAPHHSHHLGTITEVKPTPASPWLAVPTPVIQPAPATPPTRGGRTVPGRHLDAPAADAPVPTAAASRTPRGRRPVRSLHTGTSR